MNTTHVNSCNLQLKDHAQTEPNIHHAPRIHILVPIPIPTLLIPQKEPLMMFLPDDNKTQPRSLGLFRSILSIHDGRHSWDINLRKLTLGHAVSIKHDAVREGLLTRLKCSRRSSNMLSMSSIISRRRSWTHVVAT